MMYVLWYSNRSNQIGYLELGETNLAVEFFIKLGNWILIFGYFIS